jgi:Undecaprenyl-phosphate glucose phosphotransferase
MTEASQKVQAMIPVVTTYRGKRSAGDRRVKGSLRYWVASVALIEFLIVSVTAYIVSLVYHQIVYDSHPKIAQYGIASLILAAFYSLICLTDNQYDLLGEKWRQRGISRGVGAVALAFAFFLSFSFIFKVADDYSRGTFFLQFALVIPTIGLTRAVLALLLTRAGRFKKLLGSELIVISLTGNYQVNGLAAKFCEAPDKIVKSYDVDPTKLARTNSNLTEAFTERLAIIQTECRRFRADIIVIVYSAANHEYVERIVEAFYEMPVNIRLLPIGMIQFMQRSQIIGSGKLRMLEILSGPISMSLRFLKRTMDLIVATFAIIALSPLLMLVVIAIKLDSRGPVLFRQTRHGFNNEPIKVLKFRTMVTAACDARFRQTTKKDLRVTRIGYLLRKTNIDELPQLFNVIHGEMSIVGPRPHAVEHNKMFADRVKLFGRRHNVKPGITGWAQVNGYRGLTDTCEKMRKRIEYDLYYIDNWSLFFDVKILLMTIFSKRAYINAY